MKNSIQKKMPYYLAFFTFLYLLTFCKPSKSSGQTLASVQIANKKIISEGFGHWANSTGSFFDLLSDNMEWTITGSTPFSKTYYGKKQFMDEVIIPLNERLAKKIVPSVKGIYADGEMVIALWDGTATAIDGRSYNASYSWYMQMQQGKIVHVVAFLDGIEFADIMKRITPAKQD